VGAAVEIARGRQIGGQGGVLLVHARGDDDRGADGQRQHGICAPSHARILRDGAGSVQPRKLERVAPRP
jgi:hypothetical protein